MKIFILHISLLIVIVGCIPPALRVPTSLRGPKGETGKTGPKGETGKQGKAGKGLSELQLKKINNLLDQNSEYLVGSTSYNFGFAPTITGFAYLTNVGRVYKLQNKNSQALGKDIELIVRIAERKDFNAITRIAYGEDIKQAFSAATKDGSIYTSTDLKKWTTIQDRIIMNKN